MEVQTMNTGVEIGLFSLVVLCCYFLRTCPSCGSFKRIVRFAKEEIGEIYTFWGTPGPEKVMLHTVMRQQRCKKCDFCFKEKLYDAVATPIES